MRVLLVSERMADEGGIEISLSALASGLREAGDEVRILVTDGGSAAASADYVARGLPSAASQAFGQLVNPSAVAVMRRAVTSFRPDVVHVSMFEQELSPAALIAVGRTPIVLNIAWYKPICPTGHKLYPDGSLCERPWGRACRRCLSAVRWPREMIRYALIERALCSSAAVLTCSRWMERFLARAGIGSTWVPFPVSPPSPGYVRRPAASPLLVAVGRLSREKGLDGLVRAFARVRERRADVRLRIVGDGPQRGSLEQLVGELDLGDAVDFTGWIPHADVEGAIADAWSLVVPSLWAEPLGLAAIEAAIRGIPVVASAVGGLSETVELGRAGTLYRNGDEDALVERLADIVSLSEPLEVDREGIASLAALHDPAAFVTASRRLFAGLAA
jgi:glycosyltransferase involved in cell wall biosynthesis